MDEISLSLVSLAISILAFIVSFLVLREHRKKTQIMTREFEFFEENVEIKREILKVIRHLDAIIRRIVELKRMYGFVESGSSFHSMLLERVRDFKRDTNTLRIRVNEIDGHATSSFSSFESFQDFFEDKAQDFYEHQFHGALMRKLVRFMAKITTRFKPCDRIMAKIILNPDVEIGSIEIGDYINNIYSIKRIHRGLERFENNMSMFDQSITTDVLNIYLEMLRSFFNGVT